MYALGNDRTKNFCQTWTKPNLRFFFAEPNQPKPAEPQTEISVAS